METLGLRDQPRIELSSRQRCNRRQRSEVKVATRMGVLSLNMKTAVVSNPVILNRQSCSSEVVATTTAVAAVLEVDVVLVALVERDKVY